MQYISDVRAARLDLRKSLDIVKVVSDDLGPAVKQSGKDSFYFCPFHSETKNPSFAVHSQLQLYKCFPGGTPVRTSTGTKHISSIVRGDMVVSHDGSYMQVYDTLSYNHNGSMIDLSIHKLQSNIVSTPEHPYYVYDSRDNTLKWKEAKELTSYDYVRISVCKDTFDVHTIHGHDIPEYVDACNHSYGHYKTNIEVTAELMMLAGYYVTKGYIGRDKSRVLYLGFALNKNETKYVNDVILAVKNIFNVACDIKTIRNTTYITVHSKPVAVLFKHLFGEYYNKRTVPAWAETLPYNKSIAFVTGAMRGGGTLSSSNSKRGYLSKLSMTSEDVVKSVWRILVRNGIPASLTCGKVLKDGKYKVWNCNIYTDLNTNILHHIWPNRATYNRLHTEWCNIDGFLHYKVKSKKTINNWSGVVYNLEVSNDHSYTVGDSVACHNCFGCQKGGDVVTWTQEYHGITVHDAIIKLATQYNVDISVHLRPPTKEELQRNRYRLICEEAAKYCSASLLSNKDLLDSYLVDTGFTLDQVVTYDVGYCQSPDGIIQHLWRTIKDLTQDDVDRLEFTNKVQWTDVLVYPIREVNGYVARFYNKPMNPMSSDGGKYIGTSHRHPLFTNKLVYGLNVLVKNLRKNNYIVRLCEGQKAAIASNGCAVMGTEIHEAQIELLRECGVKEVRVAFDGDAPGRAASVRLLDHINQFTGINLLLAKMPDGKQPDGVRKEFGKEALDILYNMSVLPIQFFVDLRRDASGKLQLEDKFSLVTELREHLCSIPEIQLDLTAAYLSSVLNVDAESIKSYTIDIKLDVNGLLNRDAELTVLQYGLINIKSWSTIKQAVTDVKVFTNTNYQYVFRVIDLVHKKARDNGIPDSVTVQAVRDEIKIQYPQLPELVKTIDNLLIAQSKYDFTDALQRIVDMYRRRQGIDQSKQLQSMLGDLSKPINDVLSRYRRTMVSSMSIKKDDTSLPHLLADAVRKEIEIRSMRKSAIVGYDFSNLRDVDGQTINCLTSTCLAMSGLQKGHFSVISSYTGVGKSLISLQMATALAVCPPPQDQVPVLWIPLEMTPEEITMRQISLISGVDNKKVQTGLLNKDEQGKVNKALEIIACSQFYCKKTSTGTIDEIFSIVDEYSFKFGIKGVCIDYIQLVASGESDKGASREQVIGRASKVLKNQVAEGMGLFSLTISQQNRSNYTHGDTGTVQNMSGSYAIAQDADEVLLLSEKTAEQMAESNNNANRHAFLDKRRGGLSDITIDYELDINKTVSLRWIEVLNTNQLMGLSKGIKV